MSANCLLRKPYLHEVGSSKKLFLPFRKDTFHDSVYVVVKTILNRSQFSITERFKCSYSHRIFAKNRLLEPPSLPSPLKSAAGTASSRTDATRYKNNTLHIIRRKHYCTDRIVYMLYVPNNDLQFFSIFFFSPHAVY